jgi:hypothetical protein
VGYVKRNEPCPCGSGKKYKKCCLVQIQDAQEENSGESPFITELKPDVDEAVSTALDHLLPDIGYRENVKSGGFLMSIPITI